MSNYEKAIIVMLIALILITVLYIVSTLSLSKKVGELEMKIFIIKGKYFDLDEKTFDLEKRVEKLESKDDVNTPPEDHSMQAREYTLNAIKDYPISDEILRQTLAETDEAELKQSDEKMPEWYYEWYYLRLNNEIIDRTKLLQKYGDKWYVEGDTLTYTNKKGIKCSRKVYGKAEDLQSLCDLFLLINSKTKTIEALTVGILNLDWLKTKAKNDDLVLYGGILVADDYYVNFVCEYNPNSDLFYSIER